MQIFLPSPSCLQTARQLDKRRLNKQIIEAAQILRAIDGESRGCIVRTSYGSSCTGPA